MFTRFSIEKKILLSVGILVVGYIASAGYGYFAGEARERSLKSVGDRSVPVTLQCQSVLFEFESATKGFADAAMTGDAEPLNAADIHAKKAAAKLDGIEAHVNVIGLEAGSVTALKKRVLDLETARREVFTSMTSSDEKVREGAQSQAAGLEEATVKLRADLTRLSAQATDALNNILATTIHDTKEQRHNNLVGACIVALIGSVVVYLVVRRAVVLPSEAVAKGLSDTSVSVDEAAGRIRAASEQLSEGASSQAASLEETSATLEQIASVAKRNAQASQEAKEKAASARGATDDGIASMGGMRSAMSEIKQASDNIAKIVKTIDEIAFQTNLLALNAAVEAARAGSAGAGFAVVADEVRALAQRSASAARETADLIADSIAKSDRGVKLSEDVAGGLESIGKHIREVDTLVGEIAAASHEQSQGVIEVNKSVVHLNEATQQNAATAEESYATVQELGERATGLRQLTRSLEETIHGRKSSKGGTRRLPKKKKPEETPIAASTPETKSEKPSKRLNCVKRILQAF